MIVSGNYALREHGLLRNDQDYEGSKDLDRVKIGLTHGTPKILFWFSVYEKNISFH
jgi:hypothetical protein